MEIREVVNGNGWIARLRNTDGGVELAVTPRLLSAEELRVLAESLTTAADDVDAGTW